MMSYYQGLLKTTRCYQKIDFHFLESYMQNAFDIFKCYRPQNSTVWFDFCVDVVNSFPQLTCKSRINIDPNVTTHYLSCISNDGNKEKRFLDVVLATRRAYVVRHVSDALSVKINYHYVLHHAFVNFMEIIDIWWNGYLQNPCRSVSLYYFRWLFLH